MNIYYTKTEILQAVRCGRLSIQAASKQLAQLKKCASNKAAAIQAGA